MKDVSYSEQWAPFRQNIYQILNIDYSEIVNILMDAQHYLNVAEYLKQSCKEELTSVQFFDRQCFHWQMLR